MQKLSELQCFGVIVDSGKGRAVDVFALRERVVGEYRDYFQSFVSILDERLARFVEQRLASGDRCFTSVDEFREYVMRDVLALAPAEA